RGAGAAALAVRARVRELASRRGPRRTGGGPRPVRPRKSTTRCACQRATSLSRVRRSTQKPRVSRAAAPPPVMPSERLPPYALVLQRRPGAAAARAAALDAPRGLPRGRGAREGG